MKKNTIFTSALSFLVVSSMMIFTSCTKTESTINSSSEFKLERDNLQGHITSGTVVLESGTYKLTGPLDVASGATLKINPGVVIESQGNGSEGYIAIQQGGKIDAQGTSSNPIKFTSVVKTAGSWGGIVLCGNAPSNKGASNQAEITGYTYGGTNEEDNSGTMKYCIVEYSGNKISGTKEFNGISFFGVGSGTTIDYIKVTDCSDDAYEFFGGTVNCKHLFAYNVEDDLFDWTEGFHGSIQNSYGDFGTSNASDDSRGIEADNLEGNFDATPTSNPTIVNLSVIGRTSTPNAGEQKEGIKLRRGTKGSMTNIYIKNFTTGVNIESDQSLAAYADGSLSINDINIVGADKEFTGKTSSGDSAPITISVGTATGAGSSTPSWANF